MAHLDRFIEPFNTICGRDARPDSGRVDPIAICCRAIIEYECGYAELAAADAYVALILIEAVQDVDNIDQEDFLPTMCNQDGHAALWPNLLHGTKEIRDCLIRTTKVSVLRTLTYALTDLGCHQDAARYQKKLDVMRYDLWQQTLDTPSTKGPECMLDEELRNALSLRAWVERVDVHRMKSPSKCSPYKSNIGLARRLIYPWNFFELDRTAEKNLRIINDDLREVAPDLEVRATELPDLSKGDYQNSQREMSAEAVENSKSEAMFNQISSASEIGSNLQLGLFARRPLPRGETILREKSVLTAVRDPTASLCDACTGPLGALGSDNPPLSCTECQTAVFCGEACRQLAMESYHGDPHRILKAVANGSKHGANGRIKIEEQDERRKEKLWPFCTNAPESLSDIGRDAVSNTPGDDLYFLLLTRAAMMAERQNLHPLVLDETRWLCGDFDEREDVRNYIDKRVAVLIEDPEHQRITTTHKRTLPWSLKQNVILPLRFFTLLATAQRTSVKQESEDDEAASIDSRETIGDWWLSTSPMYSSPFRPYSKHWLKNYDWWIINTLYAKFRGVASARQSTWDGKPEAAGVHWRWSLANHSCNPNVSWRWAETGSDGLVPIPIPDDEVELSRGKGKTDEKREEKEANLYGAGQWEYDTTGANPHASNGKQNCFPHQLDHDGFITFTVRQEPVWTDPNSDPGKPPVKKDDALSLSVEWENGIPAGAEVFSHYCDVSLPVGERRAYARGALGGLCVCERCVVEAGERKGGVP